MAGGGAWGLGLFQSDFDYDHMQDLTWDSGLLELEAEDAERLGKKAVYHTAFHRVVAHDPDGTDFRNLEHNYVDKVDAAKADGEIYYHLYAPMCSSPKRVRRWLEKTEGQPGRISVVVRMTKKYQALATLKKDDPKRPGYVCVLLGACLMSLGCKLSDDFLDFLRATYAHRKRVGLMRDAIKQMSKALFGPDGYKNDGTPYDFGSKGLELQVKTGGPPMEDRYHPMQINVPSPSGTHPQELDRLGELYGKKIYSRTKASMDKKFQDALGVEETYGADVCGGCGAEDGKGGKVLVKCVKCKERQYCSKECQKSEWPQHKKVCRSVVEEFAQLAVDDLD